MCSAILLWHEKKLRHAELNNQANADVAGNNQVGDSSNDASSTTYDDDARTIVDMKFSEKDQQPMASYEGSLTGLSPRVSPQPQDADVARSYMSSPMAASATVNDFASPCSPPVPGNTYSPLPAPYTPLSNAMAPVAYAGSPYPSTTDTFIPQQQQPYSPYQPSSPYVSNDSPYSYHQQAPSAPIVTSPYPIPSPQQAYPSSPLYQQAPTAMYQTTTPSPLSQQHAATAPMYQQPQNYIPQEYSPHLANI